MFKDRVVSGAVDIFLGRTKCTKDSMPLLVHSMLFTLEQVFCSERMVSGVSIDLTIM